MSSDLLCCAEKLVYVLAISNMDASSRMIQELRRLLEIFQPPDAFLFLDGNPGRIVLLFKRCRPLEFLPGPELNGRQPQRHTLDCNCEARMHQDAANRVRSEATRLIPSTVYALGDADRFGIFALIAKLGCVVQHQQRDLQWLRRDHLSIGNGRPECPLR